MVESFPKSKSFGLDRWNVDFFVKLFDFVGSDLLNVVEESRLHGSVSGAPNSTFIAIIPKCDLS